VDLDEAADRLYGLPPDRFMAERTALVAAAKQAGDRALAKEISKLRRPTVAAWAVNQASRACPDALGELLELGEELRRAWREQDGDAVGELGRRRGPVTARLLRRLAEHAEASGRPLSGSVPTEVERTLDAAAVDDEAAEQVRRGRLVRPLSYTGFTPEPARPEPRETAVQEAGTAREPDSAQPGQPASEPPPSSSGQALSPGPSTGAAEGPGSGRGRVDGGARRAAVEARRAAVEARRAAEAEARRAAERERRQRAAAEARQAAARAEQDHEEWAAELATATADHDRLRGRVEALTRELAEARDALAATEHRLDVARREEARSRRSRTTARNRAEEAARAAE
jgi:flagellar biosynthesis GTPase FlhF